MAVQHPSKDPLKDGLAKDFAQIVKPFVGFEGRGKYFQLRLDYDRVKKVHVNVMINVNEKHAMNITVKFHKTFKTNGKLQIKGKIPDTSEIHANAMHLISYCFSDVGFFLLFLFHNQHDRVGKIFVEFSRKSEKSVDVVRNRSIKWQS